MFVVRFRKHDPLIAKTILHVSRRVALMKPEPKSRTRNAGGGVKPKPWTRNEHVNLAPRIIQVPRTLVFFMFRGFSHSADEEKHSSGLEFEAEGSASRSSVF